MKNLDEEIIKRVDNNTEKLHKEFIEFKKLCESTQGITDHRIIYESWIIQKISGLQCAINEINESRM